MHITCPRCHTKYRDIDAAGAATEHVCPPRVLVTVKRRGVELEVEESQLHAGDVEVSRKEARWPRRPHRASRADSSIALASPAAAGAAGAVDAPADESHDESTIE